MQTNGYFEFLTHFFDLEDPREDLGSNHLLIDRVGRVLCGTICGAKAWADIERFSKAHQAEFEQFLELPFGIPAHDTFGRVFRILDTEQIFDERSRQFRYRNRPSEEGRSKWLTLLRKKLSFSIPNRFIPAHLDTFVSPAPLFFCKISGVPQFRCIALSKQHRKEPV